MPEDDS